jgi:hypothetical protein
MEVVNSKKHPADVSLKDVNKAIKEIRSTLKSIGEKCDSE